jgi:hypothetical protein
MARLGRGISATRVHRCIRGLKGLTLEEAKGFPEELTILERRALMLPRVGFVVLTTVLLLMIYAAHGL